MAKQFKRRNYFIDKGAQSRFIYGFVLASIAGVIAAVLVFRFYAHKKLEATLYSMRLPEVAMGHLLLNEMLIASGIAACFVILLFFFIARKVFNRINGPLKRYYTQAPEGVITMSLG